MNVIKSVITNVLTALYQPFWFAVLLSILFMFVWKHYNNINSAVREWIGWFKTEPEFRSMFLLVFFIVMILFRTLLNRNMWQNPLQDVIGVWGLYKENNGEKVLTTEVIENLMLFIPFSVLLLWNYKEKLFKGHTAMMAYVFRSAMITFMFSFTIEFLQLFLRLGTWQLSDLFYNTIGGGVGGLIYYVMQRKR